MMTGRNGVAKNGAGSNRMGGVERDQRDAVTGHAEDLQSFDNTIVAIFKMYAVASAVGKCQIIQNQIVRRVAVLLVRINHACAARPTAAAGRFGVLIRSDEVVLRFVPAVMEIVNFAVAECCALSCTLKPIEQPSGRRAGGDAPQIRDTPPCALSRDEYKLPTVPEGMLLVVIIRFEEVATEAVGLVLPQPANE